MIKRSTRRKQPKEVDLIRNVNVTPSSFSELIVNFYAALDSDLARTASDLYLTGRHAELVKLEVEVDRYTDPLAFARDYAAISFLRKADFLKTGINTKQVALDGFHANEARCRVTNRRFRHLLSERNYDVLNVAMLESMRCEIARVLGPFVGEEFFDSGAWGPGVSTLIKGNDTSAVRKFRDEREITSSLYRLVGPFLHSAYPGWFPDDLLHGLTFRESSKLITVPKNAKTDRTIAVEPGLNIWFQKAIGKMIRRRLSRHGYDLNSDVKSHEMAREGSLSNQIATVDFSSASDNISYEVVKYLLPEDWFVALNACRSSSVTQEDGTRIDLQKFSSMGNGFTFELESLIFVTAARVVSKRFGGRFSSISVFGDDITLDSSCFSAYKSLAQFLGFTVSEEKSFFDGPFREACGAYYFKGFNVKPYFLKKAVTNAKAVYKLANGLRGLAHRHNDCHGCDLRFRNVHEMVLRLIPEKLLIRGSATSGDGCIHSSWDEAAPFVRSAKHGFEGFLHKCFVEVPVTRDSDSPAVLLTRLRYGSGERPSGNSYELRSVTRTRLKNVLVQQWYDLGPWC